MPAEPLPVGARVSVVVVNFRTPLLTLDCLTALRLLDSAAVEIICVDNASGDDSETLLQSTLDVRFVRAPRNLGFAGGCNLGARHATGEFLAFINSDARPDARWLDEALDVLTHDSTIGCVASKVLDWQGERIDYVDASLTWFGMGFKPGAGTEYSGNSEQPHDVLFATGAGMVIRTRLFNDIGGFDDRFFMFYEDVDLGWRLNLFGHRVRYVPSSVVYHRHHATVGPYGDHSEWFLLERNALLAMYKNLSDEALGRLLAPAMALAVRRSLAVGSADPAMLDIERGARAGAQDTARVSKRSLTASYAIDSFIDLLPSLASSRASVQARRVRSDRQLRPLLGDVMEPAIPEPRYLQGHQTLVDVFGIEDLFATGQRILVVTGDPISAKLAGPAIRALHIAEALSAEHDVRLVSTSYVEVGRDGFEVQARAPGELRADVAWADVIVFQGFLLAQAPWVVKTDKILVVDLYDPMHLEQLEQTRGLETVGRDRDLDSTVGAVNDQLRRGDFFLCASEVQRNFWLGQLAALGRINSRTYDSDASLRELVAVVPFGLPSTPPQQSSSPIRDGSVRGIGPDSRVILWAGGIYEWLDPLTLVRAMALLSQRRDNVRLFFLGTSHPNRHLPSSKTQVSVRALAQSLGLVGKCVFFNEGWVDFDQRQNYLLDADLGVSTHFDSIESTFSFRTRILDYLWAGLPVVVTEGDMFAGLVRERGIGLVVPAGDAEALADSLERCLFDPQLVQVCRASARAVAKEFTWEIALAPLVEFARAPRRAKDAIDPGVLEGSAGSWAAGSWAAGSWAAGSWAASEWAWREGVRAAGGVARLIRRRLHVVRRKVR